MRTSQDVRTSLFSTFPRGRPPMAGHDRSELFVTTKASGCCKGMLLDGASWCLQNSSFPCFCQDFHAVCVFETSKSGWDGLHPSAILGGRFLQAVCILKGTPGWSLQGLLGLHGLHMDAWIEKHGLCSGLAFGISLRVLNHSGAAGALGFWASFGASPLASPSLRLWTSSNCRSCSIALRWKISLKPEHFGSV